MRIDRLTKHYKEVQSHVGHTIRYYSGGHSRNYGTILRIQLRPDVSGVAIWLKRDRFPELIFSDQFIACECQDKTTQQPTI